MMSFVEKYKGNLFDLQDNKRTLSIKEDGYSGSSLKLSDLWGDDPITLEYSGQDSKKYSKFVFGSKLSVKLIAHNEGDFDEFLAVSDRQYQVSINAGGVTETNYNGSFSISQIASNPERFSYFEPSGDFSISAYQKPTTSEPNPCNEESIRLLIGGVEKAHYLEIAVTNQNEISSQKVMSKLIENLLNNDSNYSAEKDNDNYYCKIIRNGSYSFSDSITIEKYYETCPANNGWYSVDTGNFGDGWSGDALKLEVDEDGTVTTFFDYVLQQDDSKQNVISQAVAGINANADYEAEQNSGNNDIIDVTYIGSSNASTYVLQKTTNSQVSDWGVTVDGINEVTSERENSLWTGFIIPGMSDRPYTASPYPFIIESTDGLGDLKDATFTYNTGRLSAIRIIALILQETGLNLDIYSAANVYETNMNSASSDDPLEQKYIELESIGGKNDIAVLEEILLTQNCELRQSEGAWYIRTLNETGSLNYRVFDYEGNKKRSKAKDQKQTISGKDNYLSLGYGVNIGMNAMLRIEPGVKSFEYKQDYGLKEQLIKDPTLAIFQSEGSLLYWNGDTDYIQNSNEHLEFQSSNQRIWQEVDVLDEAIAISIELKGRIDVEIRVFDAYSNSTYWLRGGTSLGSQPWVYELDYNEMKTRTFEVDFSADTETIGKIEIGIISKEVNCVVKKVTVNPSETGFTKGKSQKLSYDIGGYLKEKKEIEFMKGDVPVWFWSKKKYLNGYYLADGSMTDGWGAGDEDLVKLIAKIIAREILQNYRVIEGTYQFKDFVPASHYLYSTFDAKNYKLLGGKYSFRFNRFKGKWIEIGKPDPS